MPELTVRQIVIEKDKARILPINKVKGEITVCPDKSITHRAVMLSAISRGISRIKNYLSADDCQRTISCLRELGIEIREEQNNLVVYGKGKAGLSPTKKMLDAGNSGTTIRLLSGILSGCRFSSKITGDDSLRSRPMQRIITPLEMMGAKISASGDSRNSKEKYPPLTISGKYPLKPISYNLPVASAQVKSAVLLAGLFADGETTVVEPLPSRDHTERMLKFFGVPLKKKGNRITLSGNVDLKARELEIAGDFSAASFFIVLALVLADSKIKISSVGINPTRIGFLEIIRKMGGKVTLSNQREISGEPVADIFAETSKLRSISLKKEEIPLMIDEIPLFAFLATQAAGVSEISGAEELKHKESDRIETISSQLNLLGAKVKTKPDGLMIEGPTKLKGTGVRSFADHRIAMTEVIAGLTAQRETVIENIDCIKTSFPNFWNILNELV